MMKSERLKKLEAELQDLEQWLQLGLVPKRDLEGHKGEINSLKKRIHEEEQRLAELRENGDIEEFVAPKRNAPRPTYQEPQTLPGIEIESEGLTDAGFDMESESYDTEATASGTEEKTNELTLSDEDEEDPFSDRNRWRRGILEDPDSDDW